jgi:formylglycine-generating enzyme required for sulfatase activity
LTPPKSRRSTPIEHGTGNLDASYYPQRSPWHAACRAGTTTEYSFGDDLAELGEYAWHGKNSNGRSGKVGTKRPNPFGLFDMHGNTREWCADWYGKTWYKRSPTEDPVGPEAGTGRVLRGGKWLNKEPYLRSAYRFDYWPSYRSQYFGFRVVCERCVD